MTVKSQKGLSDFGEPFQPFLAIKSFTSLNVCDDNLLCLIDRTKRYKMSMSSLSPGACFSKLPKTFRARKVILSSSVSKNGEVYIPETSCMKRTSVHIKNMWIKQLCNRKFPDFAMALRARKVFGAFEKRVPDPIFWACSEYSFRILNQSDLLVLTGSPWIADFRFWTKPQPQARRIAGSGDELTNWR